MIIYYAGSAGLVDRVGERRVCVYGVEQRVVGCSRGGGGGKGHVLRETTSRGEGYCVKEGGGEEEERERERAGRVRLHYSLGNLG